MDLVGGRVFFFVDTHVTVARVNGGKRGITEAALETPGGSERANFLVFGLFVVNLQLISVSGHFFYAVANGATCRRVIFRIGIDTSRVAGRVRTRRTAHPFLIRGRCVVVVVMVLRSRTCGHVYVEFVQLEKYLKEKFLDTQNYQNKNKHIATVPPKLHINRLLSKIKDSNALEAKNIRI